MFINEISFQTCVFESSDNRHTDSVGGRVHYINAMQQRKKGLMDGLFSNKTTSKLELTEQDLQGLFDSF